MTELDLYDDREQTLVKHVILKSYLERFAHIIGTFADAITYVDCFAGPWNVRSNDLKDSSFAIALDELRKARDTHAQRGRNLKLRCFFLEKDRKAYGKLAEFAAGATDTEIQTRNSTLENAINDILEFVLRGGHGSFPFILIDPTGWTGFGMQKIAPLLKLKPSEVLINLMTGHIRRFIEAPSDQTQDSFVDLFGSADYKAKVQGLVRQDREDALVEAYAENVRRIGGFRHSCSAIVLHPEIDRTHFHLIYATRVPKGVEVFKESEQKAMKVMEKARANAQQRKRVQRTRRLELFGSDVGYSSTLYEDLRERYLSRARALVQQNIELNERVRYDDAWSIALALPLVWERDLKEWIREWIQNGQLRIDGLAPNQRIPKRDKNHFLVWTAARESSQL